MMNVHDKTTQPPNSDIPLKRRRLSGSCDHCKKKKIKCDSITKPNQKCTNCVAYDVDCTHEQISKKRGPKSTYTESLEQRLRVVESLLQNINETATTSSCNVGASVSTKTPLNAVSSPLPAYSTSMAKCPYANMPTLDGPAADDTPPSIISSPQQPHLSSNDTENDDDLEHNDILQQMEKLTIYNNPRFFGSSSSFALAQRVSKLKATVVGEEEDQSIGQGEPHYYYLQPWEQATAERQRSKYIFPPPDLIVPLISLYFEHVGPFFPIIHRPSFMSLIARGEHLRSDHFAATLLLVLAVASRYSDDPRVLMDGYSSPLSAGWKFYEQVSLNKNGVWNAPTLYELQTYTLATIFINGTSIPQTSWTMTAIGLRAAIEIGVHRRKPEGHKFTVEDELKKRTFWCLLYIERLSSVFLGRPSMIRDEDHDLERPVECDDEYWHIAPNGEVTFHQPPNQPSKLVYFTQQIRLCEILACVMRTLYSIKKSKTTHGLVGNEWAEKVVTQLESAMSEAFNNMPDHLRWDPHKEKSSIFAGQSAALNCFFYMAEIEIHRPFITKASSLAACTTAARACINIVDGSPVPVHSIPFMMLPPLISGIVLCMNMWSGQGTDYEKEIDVCLKMLKVGSERWNSHGRLWNMLQQLSTGMRNLAEPSRKRAREAEVQEFWNDLVSPNGMEPIRPPLDGVGLDTDFMTSEDMWAVAPDGFSLQEWGDYINHLSFASGIDTEPTPSG